jgi:hypothetical protein
VSAHAICKRITALEGLQTCAIGVRFAFVEMEGDMHRIIQRHLSVGVICGAALLAVPALAGQETPPVTGTIALEGTVDQTYKAANTVIGRNQGRCALYN